MKVNIENHNTVEKAQQMGSTVEGRRSKKDSSQFKKEIV
jgi:hypothetical protein